MSRKITIPANEAGLVRVFSLSLTDEEAKTIKANEGTPSPQAQALGVADLDPAHVEVFALADLGDMSLADYLIEGAGALPKPLHADRSKLAALEGWVMVVYSSAFGDSAVEAHPAPVLTLIGTYPQEGLDLSAPIDLSTPSALPREAESPEPPAKKRPSDAAMSGRIAMLALLVAFFVVGLMIWVGS
jgi:hypothetical protein